jgi:flagellar basal body-associated protein FliL
MPPFEENIIITIAIIIAALTVMTLYVLFFNMKDVCFSKYTTAVSKKRTEQATSPPSPLLKARGGTANR